MHPTVPCTLSWEPIEKYINEQYEKFLKEEVNIARKKRIPDTRVHCCLYFISPTGHSYVLALSPSKTCIWLASWVSTQGWTSNALTWLGRAEERG